MRQYASFTSRCRSLPRSKQQQVVGSDERVVDSVENGAGLDRVSLARHFGLGNDMIERLLKGMFVYTFGFRELLHRLVRHCANGPQLLASVWDSYLALLENADREQYEVRPLPPPLLSYMFSGPGQRFGALSASNQTCA